MILGRVVRKRFNANPEANLLSIILVQNVEAVSCTVRNHPSSKLKDKQEKPKTSPKKHKTEIKILANSGLD